jgi:hypothetical protein
MDRTKVLLMGVIALSVVLALTDTQAQPTLLAPLPRPDGITTDPGGEAVGLRCDGDPRHSQWRTGSGMAA